VTCRLHDSQAEQCQALLPSLEVSWLRFFLNKARESPNKEQAAALGSCGWRSAEEV